MLFRFRWLYRYDEAIFSNPNAICETCQTRKPARSKHDRRCNVCVARFDHFCVWVNNAIGLRNHRYFLLFVLNNLLATAYPVFIIGSVLLHKIDESSLMRTTSFDLNTGQRVSASWTSVALSLFAQNGMLFAVFIECIVAGPILFVFFFWHVFIVARGTTTNERIKWKQAIANLNNLERGCKLGGSLEGKDPGCTDIPVKIPDMRNIYNKGVLNNFREVLFPPDVDQFIENTMDTPNTERRKDKRS